MLLTRLTTEPVLRPVPEHAWERAAVFNAAMVYHDNLFHLIYRATDLGGAERYGRYINSLGYATSADLVHWQRHAEPIFQSNGSPEELRGPEDPRIVQIEDTFYMLYTGFGGRYTGDFRICMATSRNLVQWERKGVVFAEQNKNASLFPVKINGCYGLLHRRQTDIWICYSEDLITWRDHSILMSPLPGTWNQCRIGIAGPPIEINAGWLLIFHGVDENNCYRLGAALLDRADPGLVLARQAEPIIEPELDWEINGLIPNVIFSCASVLKDDRVYCAYGGADTVIGVAYIDLKEAVFK